jgi:hypothetical protein
MFTSVRNRGEALSSKVNLSRATRAGIKAVVPKSNESR